LNKVDAVADDQLAERSEPVTAVLGDPVPVSATEGTGLDRLVERVEAAVPDLDRCRVTIPLTDDGLSTLSWLHDEAVRVDVEYGPEQVTAELLAESATVQKAAARIEGLSS
jgi:GTP-binding protein HflX